MEAKAQQMSKTGAAWTDLGEFKSDIARISIKNPKSIKLKKG